MAMPWTEAGASVFFVALLLLASDASVPTIAPGDVESFEGRTVVVAGFVDDVQVGVDRHRGVLHLDGHGVRFEAPGTTPPEDDAWIELRGTLHRVNGRLMLQVEPDPWTW